LKKTKDTILNKVEQLKTDTN